jgi:hypothetical protein
MDVKHKTMIILKLRLSALISALFNALDHKAEEYNDDFNIWYGEKKMISLNNTINSHGICGNNTLGLYKLKVVLPWDHY